MTMMLRWILGVTVLLGSAFAAPASPKALEAGDAWLREGGHVMEGLDIGAPSGDLAFLEHSLAGARIVGLGESSHGTRELTLLKARILAFLAERMQCRELALECDLPEADVVDAWLQGGEGEVRTCLDSLGSEVFESMEMAALFQWIRQFNAGRPASDRFHVTGLDVQRPRAAFLALCRILDEQDPGALDRWRNDLEPLRARLRPVGYASLPRRDWQRAKAALARIRKRVAGASSLRRRGGGKAQERVLQLLDSLEASVEVYLDPAGAQGIRDRAMARNAGWVLAALPRGSRLAIWAHNSHVARGVHGGRRWMGDALAREYGSAYAPVGLFFGSGGTLTYHLAGSGPSWELGPDQAPSIPPGGVEDALAGPGRSPVLWDLREADPGARAWLARPRPFLNLGIAALASPDKAKEDISLEAAFDLVGYVDRVTPVTLPPQEAPMKALASRHQPENLDFEEGGGERGPKGWWIAPRTQYRYLLTRDAPAHGQWCACLETLPEAKDVLFGDLAQTLDATPWRGRRIRYTGKVRTDGTPPGCWAQAWLRVDRKVVGDGFFDNMSDRPIHRPKWTPFVLEGDVAQDATTIFFGVILLDRGRVWVDDVRIEDAGPARGPGIRFEEP